MDQESWKNVLQRAKVKKFTILCKGTPERSYGISMFAQKTDPGVAMNLQTCLNTKCFRCENSVSSVYYVWLYPDELKNTNPLSIGEYKPVCPVCFFK